MLREKAWSPYMAGIVVGLLQIPALLIIDTFIGVSSSYVSAGGWLASVADPDIMVNPYLNKYMTSMKYAWQGSMVLAMGFGAWISMRLSGSRRKSVSPAWERLVGLTGLWPRLLMGFAGGFILMFGARWADGCTSGHGLSGVGQLAVSSLVATASFIIGGVVVARFYNKL